MTIRDGNIFLTGGTGSFGRAFVRKALDYGARRIVVFSRDELKQSQMRAEFADDNDRLRFFVGDVRDRTRLDVAMRSCETVVHAAAMKRIETCEADPGEAVATNIVGTQHVAAAAIRAGVRHAIFLSTDKAPVPHTLYGMTKAVAERLWIQSNVFAAGTETRLSATRYGNVLGSRGSVLDLWRRQVAERKPLTITSEAATRFWMTIDDAVNLVLMAENEMQGGEIFVPIVGSAPILDLARAVAMPTGDIYAPGHVVTGLRPGERLHETLISEDEGRHTIERAGHYVIRSESVTWGDPPIAGVAVPDGLVYRSDTNERQLTVDDLRRMVK